MINITLNFTEEEVRAVEAHIGQDQFQPWLQHAGKNKARQCIDRLVEEFTDKQAKKLEKQAKHDLVKETSQSDLDGFYKERHPNGLHS